MKRFFLLSILLTLFLWHCEHSIINVPKSIQEDDIRESVFRYQFQHNASGQQQNAKVYFLSLGSIEEPEDPSDEFMKRFQGHQPPVKKVSQSIVSVFEGVKDKDTGEQGLIFRVTRIAWKSDVEVEVEGGYYENGLSASGNIYRVALEGGQWVVKEDRMIWIA